MLPIHLYSLQLQAAPSCKEKVTEYHSLNSFKVRKVNALIPWCCSHCSELCTARVVYLESFLIQALQSLISFHARLSFLHFCLDSVLFSPPKATPHKPGILG